MFFDELSRPRKSGFGRKKTYTVFLEAQNDFLARGKVQRFSIRGWNDKLACVRQFCAKLEHDNFPFWSALASLCQTC
jgi:hypothetical protein